MCVIAIVVSVFIIGMCCSVVLIAIGLVMDSFSVCMCCCHNRLIRMQLEAWGDIKPNEMEWWTEGREKGCQSGLFAFCVGEIAIVVDLLVMVCFTI